MAGAKMNVDHRSTKVERIRQTESFAGSYRPIRLLGTMTGFSFFNSECVAALSASLPTPQRPAKRNVCETSSTRRLVHGMPNAPLPLFVLVGWLSYPTCLGGHHSFIRLVLILHLFVFRLQYH
jgi:hypothetical protein